MSQAKGKRSTIAILQEFSIPLIAGVVLAIIWANVDPQGYEHLWGSHGWSPFGEGSHLNLQFLSNDILMVFFFGIATKEITEACLPGGALNPLKKAINPLMATIGGVIGPIGMYFVVMKLLGDDSIARGWGVPTATDIALAWLVARLVFGAKHPAVSFLLLLAVADDAIGLGIIAIFYGDPQVPAEPVYLLLLVGGMVLAYVFRRTDVKSFWPYVLVAGALSWAGLMLAHLHPALALVPIVPFMPSHGSDEGIFAAGESERHHDTLNSFEHFFKTPIDFGLLLFGLANAGVQFSSMGSATWAVLIALLAGKTIGVSVMSIGAAKLGFPLPTGMGWREVVVAGMVAGLGLTVALFVAGVAFTDMAMQGAAKMGALMSAGAAVLALLMAKMLSIEKIEGDAVAPAHAESDSPPEAAE
jgi:NhaA family Na+:H+ antiporter